MWLSVLLGVQRLNLTSLRSLRFHAFPPVLDQDADGCPRFALMGSSADQELQKPRHVPALIRCSVKLIGIGHSTNAMTTNSASSAMTCLPCFSGAGCSTYLSRGVSGCRRVSAHVRATDDLPYLPVGRGRGSALTPPASRVWRYPTNTTPVAVWHATELIASNGTVAQLSPQITVTWHTATASGSSAGYAPTRGV